MLSDAASANLLTIPETAQWTAENPYIYDGAGLIADAAGSIHIAGPNGALNQAGWTDQMILRVTDADGSQSPVLTARNLYGPAVDQIFATEGSKYAEQDYSRHRTRSIARLLTTSEHSRG